MDFCIVGSIFRWKFYILEKEEKTLVILGTKPLRNTEDKVQWKKNVGSERIWQKIFSDVWKKRFRPQGKQRRRKLKKSQIPQKEVADSAKRHNDLRVAKRDLNDLYRQVGEKYFEEHMDYPQAEYIDLFNLIEKLRGDIEILKQEIDGGDDEAAEEDIEDIEE